MKHSNRPTELNDTTGLVSLKNIFRPVETNSIIAAAAFILLELCCAAQAGTFTYSTGGVQSGGAKQGWYNYDSTGGQSTHSSSNTNYIVGVAPESPGEFRNFFSFQVGSLGGDELLKSATLQIKHEVQGGEVVTYNLFDVSTDAATLKSGGDNATNISIYNDLGSGISYGSFSVANDGNMVILTLNQNALASLNSALGSFFSVGGALSTSDVQAQNYLFAFSGSVASQLVIETVARNAYWQGGLDNQWSSLVSGSSNFTRDSAGVDNLGVPDLPKENVVFAGNGVAQTNTELGADISIKSLTVEDSFGVQIGGTNTLTVSGSEGHVGITTIAGAGKTTIGCNLVLSGSSSVVTVNGDVLTISGAVGGDIGLIKSGSGSLVLSGVSGYTGGTMVQSGTLLVNGSVLGDVTTTGGTLGGSGLIIGNVVNQSVVSPGNSPGILSILGDYTQTATGTTLIQLASPTSHDLLVIGGRATLDGTLKLELLNGYVPGRGDIFTVLVAADGVTGTFSTLDFGGVKMTSEYGLNGLTLFTAQGLFADVRGLTPNELAVAKGLDKVVDDPKVARLVDYLDRTPGAEIPAKFERIIPFDLFAMFDAAIASAQTQDFNLERRMEEIRGGATGFSARGLSLRDSRGNINCNPAADGKQAIGKDGKDLAPAPFSDRLGFFINGSGQFVDVDNTSGASASSFNTDGITTGADYRLGDHAAVGLTAGYANTSTDGRGSGSVKIDSGKLGVYGTVFDRHFFLNGVVTGGLNDYDSDRDALNGRARGNTCGSDFNALLGTGYTYRKGGLSAGPIASVRYTSVQVDGFTENGSIAPLKISQQSESSLKSTVGMQMAYVFLIGKTEVTPQLRAQWQHEYMDNAHGLGASFAPGGGFTVYGPEIGRDSLLVDLGTSVQLTRNVGLYAFYNGDLGRANYTSHAVNGGVQISF